VTFHGPSTLVLIVDDEPLVRNVLRRTLHQRGCLVIETCDGPSALAIIDDRADLSLVILDITMPGMTGLEVLEQIRVRRPGLPVLLSSACTDVPVHVADGFLAKPYSGEQLLDALAKLLDAPN
jgi:CheY-like chemotaxis protein